MDYQMPEATLIRVFLDSTLCRHAVLGRYTDLAGLSATERSELEHGTECGYVAEPYLDDYHIP